MVRPSLKLSLLFHSSASHLNSSLVFVVSFSAFFEGNYNYAMTMDNLNFRIENDTLAKWCVHLWICEMRWDRGGEGDKTLTYKIQLQIEPMSWTVKYLHAVSSLLVRNNFYSTHSNALGGGARCRIFISKNSKTTKFRLNLYLTFRHFNLCKSFAHSVFSLLLVASSLAYSLSYIVWIECYSDCVSVRRFRSYAHFTVSKKECKCIHIFSGRFMCNAIRDISFSFTQLCFCTDSMCVCRHSSCKSVSKWSFTFAYI